MERLQKILARGGIASRRAAERLITEGRVRVNGRVVTELGEKADPRRDRVEVDGKRVVAEQPVYVVLHKPRGVVSTMSDPEGRPTVSELLAAVGARVFPVGRLDFATSGVLLASNDGEFADGLLHPRREVPKTYVVKVHGIMQTEDLERWESGVELEDGKTLRADARLLRHEDGKTWFELTIREGRNQQIRRMGEATGFPVMRLARIRFADVSIEGLAPGRYRHLSKDELVSLKKAFGVPRSVPAGLASAAAAEGAGRGGGGTRRPPQARRGAQGRAARTFGREAPREEAPREERGARPSRGEERGRPAPREERGARPSRGEQRVPSGPPWARGPKPAQDRRPSSREESPGRGRPRPEPRGESPKPGGRGRTTREESPARGRHERPRPEPRGESPKAGGRGRPSPEARGESPKPGGRGRPKPEPREESPARGRRRPR